MSAGLKTAKNSSYSMLPSADTSMDLKIRVARGPVCVCVCVHLIQKMRVARGPPPALRPRPQAPNTNVENQTRASGRMHMRTHIHTHMEWRRSRGAPRREARTTGVRASCHLRVTRAAQQRVLQR